jgi:hypothetical protein
MMNNVKVIAYFKDGSTYTIEISPVRMLAVHGPADAIEIAKEIISSTLGPVDHWEVEEDFI